MKATEIIPGLWLGNVHDSMDENFIRKNNIKVVFNCTKNLPFSPIIPIKYRIPLDDNLEEAEIQNMALWSEEIVYKIIKEYRRHNSVLVHCMAGIQRSAASVAMVLIILRKIHINEAINIIKGLRRIAFHPSVNFYKSIKYFDDKYHNEILPNISNYINKT